MRAAYHFIKKKGISKSERVENPFPQTQSLEHTSNTHPERNWKGFATHKDRTGSCKYTPSISK